MEGTLQSIWGHHDICPLLRSLHATSITHLELSSLTSLRAWGDTEKFKSEVTFLLILTGGCTKGGKVFGLAMIWVHPYQARVHTMEKAIKQLTPLPSTGSDLTYILVWLNGDDCHAPLPKEGHLSVQVMGGTCSTACRRVSQLPVCQPLSSGSQVVYLTELNGCDVPLIASSPESWPRSQPTQWQNHLTKGGHPTVQHGGARTQSSAPWQLPPFYLDSKPC